MLRYHVVIGSISAEDAVETTEAATSYGKAIAINVRHGQVRVNNAANVVETDIRCRNGLIHAIDAVVIPAAIQ